MDLGNQYGAVCYTIDILHFSLFVPSRNSISIRPEETFTVEVNQV